MTNPQQLELIISMSVLEDLGINLYGNVPAVLSEMVANAWDADATEVNIDYSQDKGEIVIRDNGLGMTRDELQAYYLTVGHKRRAAGRTVTPRGRKPMGRKGIGKLSAFSIAEIVEVETIKDSERTAISMDVNDIRKAIETAQSSDGTHHEKAGRYLPREIQGRWDFRKGTRITLKQLRKNRVHVGPDLRRRLARRFFIIGAQNDFTIKIGGRALRVEDRGYINLIEYLWTVNSAATDDVIQKISKGDVIVTDVSLEPDEADIRGWIGTVRRSGDLTRDGDDANAIALVVRGKLAAPDILTRFGVRELTSKYMVGEIHADFLDDDSYEDIATSDRQGFLEEDERYKSLIRTVRRFVREVINGRKRLKNDEAEKRAVGLLPPLAEWLKGLSPDRREAARQLLGSINNIYEDNEEAKREHFKQAIVAHQIFDARGRLKQLEALSDSFDAKTLLSAFSEFDQYEAALYHGVASIRVDVIRTLDREFLVKNQLETVVRDYLAEHLWLLDPSWDRATEPVETEKTVKRYLDGVASGLSTKEQASRFDVVYRRGPRRHVVVELKRYKRKVSLGELVDQIGKYSNALRSALTKVHEPYDAHEIVCLVGPDQEFMRTDETRRQADGALASYNGRVMTYDEMLHRALHSYSDFLKSEEKKNTLVRLLQKLSE
jgi:hypothetical protein